MKPLLIKIILSLRALLERILLGVSRAVWDEAVAATRLAETASFTGTPWEIAGKRLDLSQELLCERLTERSGVVFSPSPTTRKLAQAAHMWCKLHPVIAPVQPPTV